MVESNAAKGLRFPKPRPVMQRAFRFPLTIFLSAFLLFQIQPMIGRFVLPWFGGGPAIWTTCMLFFQVLLLAGYAYAHWLGSRPSAKMQGATHLALLPSHCFFCRSRRARRSGNSMPEPGIRRCAS